MAPATTTSVQVALRIRPSTQQDVSSIPARFQRTVIHPVSDTTVSIDAANAPAANPTASPPSATTPAQAKKQLFSFDTVLPPQSTQHNVFSSSAEPLIARFLEGFNCTILAYGQTSSGKTYTMTGEDLDADPSDPNNGMGVIPRAVSTIFSRVKQTRSEKQGAWTATIKASFVELYNEDLIDLLSSDDPSARRDVQIREDKDGHIIWGGLREVPVRSASEVMELLRQGSSIRRTNETDMNAQSSRSHAIFSLTLTQKRYTGSSLPSRSPSPAPPQGSPSRLARPGSLVSYNSPNAASRIASPTFGRPPTPSFAVAMARSQTHLRPHSSLGHSEDQRTVPSNGPGEWVTVTSKFHFVDLAGSERLKRTAAVGERVKEGISINSGLLALGNVISALGDPSKSKVTTHIPYRDSKLTRLLQDSLGGNAHTLMIACVSPAEWNVAETVNTLKYANRARNIRNRVKVEEREDGWDDLEWLQTTITRLRKELKALREGQPSGNSLGVLAEESQSKASKHVRDQLIELQSEHEKLRELLTERTEELTRLRGEHGETLRSGSGGVAAATSRYEEIVGPVIEEYERTISAMEAEMKLNRAALRHTNELVTEKEEELASLSERHATTEAYVEELRSRVSKLSERESSTEAYIRDLEEKVKGFTSDSLTDSESLTTLQKELGRYKELEGTNGAYIMELEARLAKTDESVLELQQSVERAEALAERREADVRDLERRLEQMTSDEVNWRSDLERREERVRNLELEMEAWEKRKEDAGRDRERLGLLVADVEKAKKEIGDVSAPLTPVSEGGRNNLPISQEVDELSTLQASLSEIQETHKATLADLANMTDKYRDALREISDLAAQIQEVKLHNHSPAASISISDAGDRETPVVMPPPGTISRRRQPSISRSGSRDFNAEPLAPTVNGTGRRPFFRQAASAESLRARSLSQSQSLSQELSLVRSPPRSTGSLPHNRSDSLTNGSANGRLTPTLMFSAPPHVAAHSDRTILSLEKEIMRLQEVLSEREAEITALEISLKEKSKPASSELVLAQSSELEAQDLSPNTIDQFKALRSSIILEHPAEDDEALEEVARRPESLGRLNELMRSMAQKESEHREIVEELNSELTQLRRQHDALTTLSRDQAHNMSTELEALRSEHQKVSEQLEELEKRDHELMELLQAKDQEHAQFVENLRAEHEQILREKEEEVVKLTSQLKDHESTVYELHTQLSDASVALAQAKTEHEQHFGKLQAEHESSIQQARAEAEVALQEARSQQAEALSKAQEEYNMKLSQQKEEATASQHRIEEEYYNALSKLRSEHAETLKRKELEAEEAIARSQADHVAELKQAQLAKQGSEAESQALRDSAIEQLQDEHAASLLRKENDFAAALQRNKEEHQRAMVGEQEMHGQAMAKLRSEHASAIALLNEQLSGEVSKLNALLEKARVDHDTAVVKMRKETQVALEDLVKSKARDLQDLIAQHDGDIVSLKADHELQLSQIEEAHEERLASVEQLHAEEVARLKAEHASAIAEVQALLVATQEEHHSVLENLHNQHMQAFETLKQDHNAAMSEIDEDHTREKDIWSRNHDLLSEEIAALKEAARETEHHQEESLKELYGSMEEKDEEIASLQQALTESRDLHSNSEAKLNTVLSEVETLRAEKSRLLEDVSKAQILEEELEQSRRQFAELQAELLKAKEDMDVLHADKARQDILIRDLQSQAVQHMHDVHQTALRPIAERTISFTRTNGIPPAKLPPLSPPPSIPPPPLPTALPPIPSDSHSSMSSRSVHGRSSSGSQDTHDSGSTPLTSAGPSLKDGSIMSDDSLLHSKIQSQGKQIEEQEAMIKTLNKQLAHCEGELQSHIDLVNTLETSLNDSERNLKKARGHANELTRDRDSLTSQLESARAELREAQREVVSTRQSIVEEKQSLEHRLTEERRAKERARAQLDTRMEELQRRKSKFACM